MESRGAGRRDAEPGAGAGSGGGADPGEELDWTRTDQCCIGILDVGGLVMRGMWYLEGCPKNIRWSWMGGFAHAGGQLPAFPSDQPSTTKPPIQSISNVCELRASSSEPQKSCPGLQKAIGFAGKLHRTDLAPTRGLRAPFGSDQLKGDQPECLWRLGWTGNFGVNDCPKRERETEDLYKSRKDGGLLR